MGKKQTSQSVKRWALDPEVMGLNLPAVTEVTLGGYSSCILTMPWYKIGTRSWLA